MTRERRPVSARALILGAILSVAALGLVIVGCVTFLAQRDRVLTEVDERLSSQVEALGQLQDLRVVEGSAGAEDPTATTQDAGFATVSEYLRAAVARLIPGRTEANLALSDGQVVFRSAKTLAKELAEDPAFVAEVTEQADAADGPTPPETTTIDGRSVRWIAVPISMAGDPTAGVYVRAVDTTAELRPVNASVGTFLVAALATLAAVAVVGWFVAGRLLSPIRHLRDTANAITLTDLGARIPAQGNDDIADLTRTVNSMLDRLEGSVDGQRQLLDDVRHELKTPITIVRGHLEMMDAADPEDVRATRELGISELDRMTRLVDDIDLLSSAEADQFSMNTVHLDVLTTRMHDLVTAFPDHRWVLAATARGSIEADEDRLLQAWLQLADNAAKYTPSDSEIEIGSVNTGSEVRLWVRDHGAGIPHAVRRRIFRRFDRAHGHRTVGGSGLGLAIVDAIARAHQGTCVVSDTPGGGATLTIELPIDQLDPQNGLPAPVRAGDVVLQREAAG